VWNRNPLHRPLRDRTFPAAKIVHYMGVAKGILSKKIDILTAVRAARPRWFWFTRLLVLVHLPALVLVRSTCELASRSVWGFERNQ
jgi:hypothetical protein